ncbi:heavy-metal-associated domain-containing protein [Pseudomonas sp. F1_0610]|uniref:heavy-metal-associated domain-containing protein n=1 Tax=Pseudomonas sp. F1_0610 TaxID=3114284 RepID=UPI0039C16B47
MAIFIVKDMTCGHCKGVISKALEAAGAQVTIDLATHSVEVDGIDATQAFNIIKEEGYTPEAE